jgi:hypothetical protein
MAMARGTTITPSPTRQSPTLRLLASMASTVLILQPTTGSITAPAHRDVAGTRSRSAKLNYTTPGSATFFAIELVVIGRHWLEPDRRPTSYLADRTGVNDTNRFPPTIAALSLRTIKDCALRNPN